MSKSKRLNICVSLCLYTLLFFFTRTVFPLYKYFFFVTIVPAAIAMVVLLFCYKTKLNLKRLWLPLLVFAMYLVHYAPIVIVQKEIVNTAFAFVLILFSWRYLSQKIWQQRFLKAFVVLVCIAGLVAIARFVLIHENIPIPFSKYLFAPDATSFSIADDYNFYALYQLVAIVIASYLYANKLLSKVYYVVINILSSFCFIASGSRRGYLLYALLCSILLVSLILIKNKQLLVTIKVHLVSVVSLVVVGVSLFLFVSPIRERIMLDMAYNRLTVYRISSYLTADAYGNFMHKMWDSMKDVKCVGENENLYYNGDLSKGLKFWHCTDQNGRIYLKKENGQRFIRVEKPKGVGGYQISYKGRPIYYHKGVEYVIRFNYRVVEGIADTPFYVGWWISDGGKYIHNLPHNIQKVDSVWNVCETKYVFVESHNNPPSFLNTLTKGAIIDIKDISLICNDTSGLPMFADQVPEVYADKKMYYDTTLALNNNLTYSRLERWRYATYVWDSAYNTSQKLFGRGFDYLHWYAQKFYPNKSDRKTDYPHNPIISSFLYSGIVGGVVYVAFLLSSILLYWKQRKRLGIFLIIYLIMAFFSFFSGNSHFSVPIFTFLSILPFATRDGNLKNKAIPRGK